MDTRYSYINIRKQIVDYLQSHLDIPSFLSDKYHIYKPHSEFDLTQSEKDNIHKELDADFDYNFCDIYVHATNIIYKIFDGDENRINRRFDDAKSLIKEKTLFLSESFLKGDNQSKINNAYNSHYEDYMNFSKKWDIPLQHTSKNLDIKIKFEKIHSFVKNYIPPFDHKRILDNLNEMYLEELNIFKKIYKKQNVNFPINLDKYNKATSSELRSLEKDLMKDYRKIIQNKELNKEIYKYSRLVQSLYFMNKKAGEIMVIDPKYTAYNPILKPKEKIEKSIVDMSKNRNSNLFIIKGFLLPKVLETFLLIGKEQEIKKFYTQIFFELNKKRIKDDQEKLEMKESYSKTISSYLEKNNQIELIDNKFSKENINFLGKNTHYHNYPFDLPNKKIPDFLTNILSISPKKEIIDQYKTIQKYQDIQNIKKHWDMLYYNIRTGFSLYNENQEKSLLELFDESNNDYVLPLNYFNSVHINNRLKKYNKCFHSVCDGKDVETDPDVLENHINNIKSNFNKENLDSIANELRDNESFDIQPELYETQLYIKAIIKLSHQIKVKSGNILYLNKYLNSYKILESKLKHTNFEISLYQSKFNQATKYKELSEKQLIDFIYEYASVSKISMPINLSELENYKKEFVDVKIIQTINRILSNTQHNIQTGQNILKEIKIEASLLNLKMLKEIDNVMNTNTIIEKEKNEYIKKNNLYFRLDIDYYKLIKEFIGVITCKNIFNCTEVKRLFDEITEEYNKTYLINSDSMKQLRKEIRICLNKMVLEDIQKERDTYKNILKNLEDKIQEFEKIKCSPCIKESDLEETLKLLDVGKRNEKENSIMVNKYLNIMRKELPSKVNSENNKYISKDPKIDEKIEIIENQMDSIHDHLNMFNMDDILNFYDKCNEFINFIYITDNEGKKTLKSEYHNSDVIQVLVKVENILRYNTIFNDFDDEENKQNPNIHKQKDMITEIIGFLNRDANMFYQSDFTDIISKYKEKEKNSKAYFYEAIRNQISTIYGISKNIEEQIKIAYRNESSHVKYISANKTFLGILTSNIDKVLILSSIQQYYQLPLKEADIEKSKGGDLYYKYYDDNNIKKLRENDYKELFNDENKIIFEFLELENNKLVIKSDKDLFRLYYDIYRFVGKLSDAREKIIEKSKIYFSINDFDSNKYLKPREIEKIFNNIENNMIFHENNNTDYQMEIESLRKKIDYNFRDKRSILKKSKNIMNNFVKLLSSKYNNDENIFDQIEKLRPTKHIIDQLENIYKKMHKLNKDLEPFEKLNVKIKISSIINGRKTKINKDLFTIESYYQMSLKETLKNNNFLIKSNEELDNDFKRHFYFNNDNFNYELQKYARGYKLQYDYTHEYKIEEEQEEEEKEVKTVKLNKKQKDKAKLDKLLGLNKKKKKQKIEEKEEEKKEDEKVKPKTVGPNTKKFYHDQILNNKFSKDRLFSINSKALMILLPYMNYIDGDTIEEYVKKITSTNKGMELDNYYLPSVDSMQSQMTPQEKFYHMENQHTDDLDRRLKEKVNAARLKVSRDVQTMSEMSGHAINVNSMDYKFGFIMDLFSLFEYKVLTRDTDNDLLRLRTMVNELSDISQFVVDNYQKLINVTIENNRYKMNKNNNNLALFNMYRPLFYKQDIKIKDKQIKTELITQTLDVPIILKDSVTITNRPSVFYIQLMTDITIMKERVKHLLDKPDQNFKELDLLKNNILRFILNIFDKMAKNIDKYNGSKKIFFDYIFRYFHMHNVNREIIINQKQEIYQHSKETAGLFTEKQQSIDDKYKNFNELSNVSDFLDKLVIVQTADDDEINVYKLIKNRHT